MNITPMQTTSFDIKLTESEASANLRALDYAQHVFSDRGMDQEAAECRRLAGYLRQAISDVRMGRAQ